MFFFNSNWTQSFAQLSRRNHVSSKCYVVGFEVRFLSVGECITVKIPQIQIWLNNMEHTRKMTIHGVLLPWALTLTLVWDRFFLDDIYGSKKSHVNARTQSFPQEHCTASMIIIHFISMVWTMKLTACIIAHQLKIYLDCLIFMTFSSLTNNPRQNVLVKEKRGELCNSMNTFYCLATFAVVTLKWIKLTKYFDHFWPSVWHLKGNGMFLYYHHSIINKKQLKQYKLTRSTRQKTSIMSKWSLTGNNDRNQHGGY